LQEEFEVALPHFRRALQSDPFEDRKLGIVQSAGSVGVGGFDQHAGSSLLRRQPLCIGFQRGSEFLKSQSAGLQFNQCGRRHIRLSPACISLIVLPP
jgi:hypothetical protein